VFHPNNTGSKEPKRKHQEVATYGWCVMESTTEQRDFYLRVQSAPSFLSNVRAHPKAEGEISFLLALKTQ
jgi:hypothetical protein